MLIFKWKKLILLQMWSYRAPKIEINYRVEWFVLMNNFPYLNFSKFEKDFE
jgi:hypothetical protein